MRVSCVASFLVGAIAAIGLGCTGGGAGTSSNTDRGAMMERLTASEVAANRAEARIQADRYDHGLRQASARPLGQSPDEAARQQQAADTLTREIRKLRHEVKGYRHEQKRLRAKLGIPPGGYIGQQHSFSRHRAVNIS